MTEPPRPHPAAWRIAVAGGGVPSLALALALARFGGGALAPTVIDPAPAARRRADGRAFALSPGSVRLLDALDVWPKVARRAQPIAAMTITDSRTDDPVRPDYLQFAAEDEPLGWMLEAVILEEGLATAAAAAGVETVAAAVAGFEADRDRVTLRLDGAEPRRAALLVASDGARSRLREQAGIGWVGRPYRQTALVATVRHEHPHGGRAVQHFLPSGPFAILPLPDDGGRPRHRSSIVWTEKAEAVPAVLALPGPEAAAAVAARFGQALGPIALAGPLHAHPLAFGLARAFVGRRFALLGDAAHEIHPLAGQGLNLGLGDAAALAERLVEAARLGLDPGGPDALAPYERDRRFDAVLLAGATDGLNRLFSNDNLPIRFARDLGLGLVDGAPALKRLFSAEASGTTRRAPRLMRGEPI